MNDPQVWTLIGVFAAAILGGFSIVITTSRVVRAEVGGLRSELLGVRGELGGEIAGLDTRLNGQVATLDARLTGELNSMRVEMRSGFATLTPRVDGLDREVQAITDRLMRDDR